MTRNSKLYKTTFKKKGEEIEVYFRDLTILEISFFKNISNEVIRNEMIGKTAVVDMNPSDVPWPVLGRIGEESFYRSNLEVSDDQLLEIFVTEIRDRISQDYVMLGIRDILKAFPGQSVTDLLKLTPKDFLELICLAEIVLNKPLLKAGKIKRHGLINTKNLPDDGKSLQQKMDELNQHLKR